MPSKLATKLVCMYMVEQITDLDRDGIERKKQVAAMHFPKWRLNEWYLWLLKDKHIALGFREPSWFIYIFKYQSNQTS